MRAFFFIAVLLIMGVLAPPSAFADFYQWRDEKGVLHVADDLEKVPQEYRGKAEIFKTTPGEEPSEKPTRPAPPRSSPRPDTGEELYGDRTLSWWKRAFSDKRREIGEYEGKQEQKSAYVEVFEKGRRFGQIYTKEEIDAYERYKKELPGIEKTLAKLRSQLDTLKRKARLGGVSKKIREGQ
ncbi:MAG: DUF4124 domain-containing protein [Thermodesulfobacteriota bacterium]